MATRPILPTKSPALPFAPVQYAQKYQDDFANVLRLYFNTLDSVVLALSNATSGSGENLFMPYGAFQRTTSQTGVANTEYIVGFDTTDYSSGVTIKNGDEITVDYKGLYNFQYSVQLENKDTAPQDIDVWFKKNGNNIANSNSRFGLEKEKGPGDPYHVVGTINLFIELQANEHVQLAWCTTDADAGLKAYTGLTTPTRPNIPSAILTVSFVSYV